MSSDDRHDPTDHDETDHNEEEHRAYQERRLREHEAFSQALAHKLRFLRLEAGLTQARLATKAGISFSLYQMYEGGYFGPGRPTSPKITSLIALAQALNVPLMDLLPKRLPDLLTGRPDWPLLSQPDDSKPGEPSQAAESSQIVNPAPSWRHQTITLELAVRLRAACPASMQAVIAPLGVVPAEDAALEPDVLVARRADLAERNLPTAPVLAVKVLSPGTRLFDLNVKHERFQRGGCPYWVIDPGTGTAGPTIRACELRGGVYVQVAEATGEAEFRTQLPFPIAFRPVDLLDLPKER